MLTGPWPTPLQSPDSWRREAELSHAQVTQAVKSRLQQLRWQREDQGPERAVLQTEPNQTKPPQQKRQSPSVRFGLYSEKVAFLSSL